ncbi:MAG: zinc protease [Bacteroidetes bacterium GWA2_30_7]|nr:MAG: zinc protease [Bacteroidetes bacterium GWA2_30_7]
MEYKEHILENGIKLVHKHSISPVAHCGIFIDAGSRDEKKNEHGMAHFIEHVIFKGTKKRKAYHIISSLEDVGGELDAYTTKEKTVVFATFLTQYYEKTLDIFSDIVFNSTFPPKELEKEKDVIIDEINSYNDNPYELIYDEFEQLVFDNHPLGRSILGTEKSVKSFNINDVETFMLNNYNTDRIIISSIGNISFEKLVMFFEKYFIDVKSNLRKVKRRKCSNYKISRSETDKDTYQSHCILGSVAYDIKNKNRLGLILLNNILAGNNMNSRLNMLLREKYGYVYNVESAYNYYSDTGLTYIYFGTDKENLNRVYDLIIKELKILQNNKLGSVQLKKAKSQLIGQITIASDNNLNQMFSIGKSYLMFNKVDCLDLVYSKIEKLTAMEILEIANEVFEESKISHLIYK